jgi:hypothetical protein
VLIGRDSDALRVHVPALADGFNLLDPIAVVVMCTTSCCRSCTVPARTGCCY